MAILNTKGEVIQWRDTTVEIWNKQNEMINKKMENTKIGGSIKKIAHEMPELW